MRPGQPLYRWFAGGVLNTCYNALDRHVIRGRAEQPALIFHSAYTGARRTYSYAELLERVAQLGGGLRELGVRPGDRVVIYLPMVPEAAIAMLACARIGAVHSVVFGGFAPAELAARIDDAQPKVVISASCGLEAGQVIEYKPLLDAALARTTHQPDYCVILQRPQVTAELADAARHRPGPADEARARSSRRPASRWPRPTRCTSSTPPAPRGSPRASCAIRAGTRSRWPTRCGPIYDVGPGDVMFTASDVGWVVGHSYIVYAPLLVGATTVLYEGKPVGTPDAGAFWRVVAEHRVKVDVHRPDRDPGHPQGRSRRRADGRPRHSRRCRPCSWPASGSTPTPTPGPASSSASRWSTTGGRPRPAGRSRPTRAAWSRCRSSRARRRCPCRATTSRSSTAPASRVPAGEEGAIAIRLPLPPGTLPTVWGDDQRFVDGYLSAYPGLLPDRRRRISSTRTATCS